MFLDASRFVDISPMCRWTSWCFAIGFPCWILCLEYAYSKQRIQHGKPIAKHQLVQRHIGEMSTNLEASKNIVYKAALLKQKSDLDPEDKDLRDYADVMIAKAKYFASNASFDAADRTVQILGSSGYSFETRAPRHLVDTRVCRIYEGTDEIMVQRSEER